MKIKFIFSIKYNNKVYAFPNCRFKVSQNGYVTYLIFNDKKKWQQVIGEFETITLTFK
jgi:hypothetical protein